MKWKKELPISTLCEGLPEDLQDFVKYIRRLRFTEKPNMKHLKSLLKIILKDHNLEWDYHQFDWIKKGIVIAKDTTESKSTLKCEKSFFCN